MLNINTQTLLKSLIPLNNSMVIQNKMTGSDEFKNISYLANLDLIEDELEEFGIFDVGTFIQALELLEDPEISYDTSTKRIKAKDINTSLEYITSDASSLDYVQVDPNIITSTLNASSVLEADITKETLQKIKKAYGVFKNFDTLNIVGAPLVDAKLAISSLNTFSKNNNAWSMEIPASISPETEFDISIPLESIMKIPQMDYNLQVKYNKDRDAYRVILTNDLITFVLSLKQ